VKSIADVNHDGRTDLGDQITWAFVVTNIGNVTLSGVTVNDGMLAAAGVAVSCPQTVLAPGQAMTCMSDAYTVTQADMDAGHVVNAATSTGLTPKGPKVTSNSDSTITAVMGPQAPQTRQADAAAGILAFTGVSSGLFAAGFLGLILLLLGGLFAWAARREPSAGRHRA
jgi:hypothetical protein